MIAWTNQLEKLHIGPESNGMRLMPAEFEAVDDYDDNYRYELIDGVLIVNPIADLSEVGPNEMLGQLLRGYKQYHEKGSNLDDTYPERYIRLPDSRRRADRVIYTGLGRQPSEETDVPSIVVEFVSQAKRDRVRDYELKRQEYAKVGIKEYWIIDRFDRALTAYRFSRRKQERVVVHDPDIYETPLLPGFQLKLAHIFGYADEITKANPRQRTKRKKN